MNKVLKTGHILKTQFLRALPDQEHLVPIATLYFEELWLLSVYLLYHIPNKISVPSYRTLDLGFLDRHGAYQHHSPRFQPDYILLARPAKRETRQLPLERRSAQRRRRRDHRLGHNRCFRSIQTTP